MLPARHNLMTYQVWEQLATVDMHVLVIELLFHLHDFNNTYDIKKTRSKLTPPCQFTAVNN